MTTKTIMRTDSMGYPVTEQVDIIEPENQGFMLDQLTIGFKKNFEDLVRRGVDISSFMFVFRAEKTADGEIICDRFFIDQPPFATKGEQP